MAGAAHSDDLGVSGPHVLGDVPEARLLSLHMRRCEIKVRFESGAKKKFLAVVFQPMTTISDYQSVPWSDSFQNIYNTHMCKMHLTVEK